jgi:hypothetical protein
VANRVDPTASSATQGGATHPFDPSLLVDLSGQSLPAILSWREAPLGSRPLILHNAFAQIKGSVRDKDRIFGECMEPTLALAS